MAYPRYLKNQYDPSVNNKISIILKIESEITEAVRSGHKSHWGDEFKDKRREMETLRKEIGLR